MATARKKGGVRLTSAQWISVVIALISGLFPLLNTIIDRVLPPLPAPAPVQVMALKSEQPEQFVLTSDGQTQEQTPSVESAPAPVEESVVYKIPMGDRVVAFFESIVELDWSVSIPFLLIVMALGQLIISSVARLIPERKDKTDGDSKH